VRRQRPNLFQSLEIGHLRRVAVTNRHVGSRHQPRTIAFKSINKGEGQITRIDSQAFFRCREDIVNPIGRRQLRSQFFQHCEAPVADDSLGIFDNYTEMPAHGSVVIGERAVGESVIGLLLVAVAFEKQQQGLIPGRFASL
jgi:hypothetical protein